MTEPTAQIETQPPPTSRARRIATSLSAVGRRTLRGMARAWQNPIVIKELRGRMRGWRAMVVLTVHLSMLSCFASLIYFGVSQSAAVSGRGATIGQSMGQTLFYSTYMLLLVQVVFLSPAFTSGAISGERERKTLDLLITTLLSTRALVLGKLASALAYIVLLILAALPILSLALMFGGITLPEVLIGTLILLVTALSTGCIGLFSSTLLKSSIASTVVTYAIILVTALGLPVVVFMSVSLFGIALGPATSDLSWAWQAILIYVGGFLICTNPFATAIATKLVVQEENSLLLFTVQLSDSSGASRALPLISPWTIYVLLGVAGSALLVTASILVLRHKRG